MDGENCCSEEPMDETRPTIRTRDGRGEPVPPPAERAANARIQQVENGFIAEIGCKTFVSQTWEELAAGLAEYWKNPTKAEAKFSRKK